jgi:hypothetical protein
MQAFLKNHMLAYLMPYPVNWRHHGAVRSAVVASTRIVPRFERRPTGCIAR